jgi:hypothetical protein
MRRIDTATRAQNLFGAGDDMDGFTDGDAGVPTSPTHLNATWFNHVQEELARAIESEGNEVTSSGDDDDANYFGLTDTVAAMARVVAANETARYILEGLTFDTSGASLTVTLLEGRMVYDGRRYYFSAAKLSANSALNFTLTATRDHYFFIAPENPAVPTFPPNRRTVYVARLDVAVGAAAPATPTDMVLFARLTTDGSGVTVENYNYSRGPRFMDEAGAEFILRPALASPVSRAAIIPNNSAVVDLGALDDADSVNGSLSRAYLRELHLKTTTSSLYTYFDNHYYTTLATTTAGGTTNVNIIAATNYPDGSTALVEIRAVAIDPSDPTDGYTAFIRCHVHQDGGSTWDLDGSGLTPDWQEGAGAIAATVTVAFNVSGANLRLVLTGHSGDAMRWVLEVHVIVLAD